MKNILLLITLIAIGTFVTTAQGTKQAEPTETPQPVADRPNDRGNILRELGLSPEQARQIRRLNMARKPMMDAAQQRLREANLSLDEAIYSDIPDETLIQERLKETQLAHAQVIRIRSMNEFAIRRILTPEQLMKFRELRQRFETARENLQTRRQERRDMKQNNKNPANVNGFRGPIQRPAKQKDPQRPNQ